MRAEKRQRPAATGRSVETALHANPEHKLSEFWNLVGAAARQPDFSRGDVAVLWAILQRVGPDGVAWPGYGRIAQDTGLDRSTVTRSVRRLVSSGCLHRES